MFFSTTSVSLTAPTTGRGSLVILNATHPQHKATKLMNHRHVTSSCYIPLYERMHPLSWWHWW
jgi:hypothetical protein